MARSSSSGSSGDPRLEFPPETPGGFIRRDDAPRTGVDATGHVQALSNAVDYLLPYASEKAGGERPDHSPAAAAPRVKRPRLFIIDIGPGTEHEVELVPEDQLFEFTSEGTVRRTKASPMLVIERCDRRIELENTLRPKGDDVAPLAVVYRSIPFASGSTEAPDPLLAATSGEDLVAVVESWPDPPVPPEPLPPPYLARVMRSTTAFISAWSAHAWRSSRLLARHLYGAARWLVLRPVYLAHAIHQQVARLAGQAQTTTVRYALVVRCQMGRALSAGARQCVAFYLRLQSVALALGQAAHSIRATVWTLGRRARLFGAQCAAVVQHALRIMLTSGVRFGLACSAAAWSLGRISQQGVRSIYAGVLCWQRRAARVLVELVSRAQHVASTLLAAGVHRGLAWYSAVRTLPPMLVERTRMMYAAVSTERRGLMLALAPHAAALRRSAGMAVVSGEVRWQASRKAMLTAARRAPLAWVALSSSSGSMRRSFHARCIAASSAAHWLVLRPVYLAHAIHQQIARLAGQAQTTTVRYALVVRCQMGRALSAGARQRVAFYLRLQSVALALGQAAHSIRATVWTLGRRARLFVAQCAAVVQHALRIMLTSGVRFGLACSAAAWSLGRISQQGVRSIYAGVLCWQRRAARVLVELVSRAQHVASTLLAAGVHRGLAWYSAVRTLPPMLVERTRMMYAAVSTERRGLMLALAPYAAALRRSAGMAVVSGEVRWQASRKAMLTAARRAPLAWVALSSSSGSMRRSFHARCIAASSFVGVAGERARKIGGVTRMRWREALRAARRSIGAVDLNRMLEPGMRPVLAVCACGAAIGGYLAFLIATSALSMPAPTPRASATTRPLASTPSVVLVEPALATASISDVRPAALAASNPPPANSTRVAPRAERATVTPASGVPARAQEDSGPVPPAQFRGSLAVRSSPEGAQVFLNGVPVGHTPLTLEDLPSGSRALRVELEGYERWSASVRVVANQETRASAELRRSAFSGAFGDR